MSRVRHARPAPSPERHAAHQNGHDGISPPSFTGGGLVAAVSRAVCQAWPRFGSTRIGGAEPTRDWLLRVALPNVPARYRRSFLAAEGPGHRAILAGLAA